MFACVAKRGGESGRCLLKFFFCVSPFFLLFFFFFFSLRRLFLVGKLMGNFEI